MTLKRLFQFFLLLLVLSVVLSHVVGEQGDDSIVFSLAAIVYFLVLLSVLEIKSGRSAALVLYFIFVSILWIAIRLAYLSYRYESINYNYLISFDHVDVAWSVLLTTFSTIAFVSGLIIGGRLKIREIGVSVPLFRSAIKVDYLIIFFVLLLFVSVLKVFVINDADSKWVAIFSIITSFDLFVVILISAFVFSYEELSLKKRWIFYLLFVGYILARTIMGSKAGVFSIGVLAITAIIAIKPRPYIHRKILGLGLLFMPFSLVMFFVGHTVREIKRLSPAGDFSFSYLMSGFGKSYTSIVEYMDVGERLDFISRRLSMFDYLNVFFNADPINDYLGLGYSLKMIWNVVWPGFISPNLEFSDAGVFPANLFKVAYGHLSYQEVLDNYHSDMLPLFGYAFINTGFLSFILLALFGFCVAISYRILLQSDLKALYLYKTLFLFFLGDILFGMGVASTFQQLVFFTILPLTVYLLLQNIRVLPRREKLAVRDNSR